MRNTLLGALATSLLLGGCAGDTTAPTVAPRASQLGTPFTPIDAQMARVRATDGSYRFTIDPSKDQRLVLGANSLELPANSICRLKGSGYGPSLWDAPCAPQREPVTITATVRGAGTSHERIDFSPAMRFSPKTNVMLYLFVPDAKEDGDDDDGDVDQNWVVRYCDAANKCIDESLKDREVTTHVNQRLGLVFREIKHFSGYVVAERYGLR
jgi:hypothetical protein